MKTLLPALLALSALPFAAPASAQTTAAHPAAHRTATHVGGGCEPTPPLSPKIPALPAGSPCVKALYTLTRTPDLKLDYASPLLSSEVKESLGAAASTFSLLYVDTKIGSGDLALPRKYLTVAYTGYLPDGTKFDSSLDHPNAEPITFPYSEHRVIEGWDTGYEGMRVGGKRRLFIPYQLAYGDAGKGPIPAKSMLIFDVELVGVSDTAPAPKQPPVPAKPPVPPPAAKPSTTPPPAASTPAAKPAPPAAAPPAATTPK